MKMYVMINLFVLGTLLLAQAAKADKAMYNVVISAKAGASYADIDLMMAEIGMETTTIKNHDEGTDTVITHDERRLQTEVNDKALRGNTATRDEDLNRKLGRTCPGKRYADCIRRKGSYYCFSMCADVYYHRGRSLWALSLFSRNKRTTSKTRTKSKASSGQSPSLFGFLGDITCGIVGLIGRCETTDVDYSSVAEDEDGLLNVFANLDLSFNADEYVSVFIDE